MDCEACAGPIRRALAKVGGSPEVEVDLAKESVTVTFEPAPGRLDAYVSAIDALGYEASLPRQPLAAGEK
jgi:copper chaperone CopZ